MKKIILLMLLPISIFGQTCHETKIDYAVQLFSTRSVELFNKKNVQQSDSLTFEKVCLKEEVKYRVLIPCDNLEKAEETRSRYTKIYPDCFIVKYVNRKRYN
jgi:hypothetical protein